MQITKLVFLINLKARMKLLYESGFKYSVLVFVRTWERTIQGDWITNTRSTTTLDVRPSLSQRVLGKVSQAASQPATCHLHLRPFPPVLGKQVRPAGFSSPTGTYTRQRPLLTNYTGNTLDASSRLFFTLLSFDSEMIEKLCSGKSTLSIL